MKIAAVIPAHMASVRFPGKVLYQFEGLPMIEHVRRRALLSDTLKDVYVATCDGEIADTVIKYGAQVIMTSDKHLNGTSRVAEAVEQIDCTHVILLQADEPLLLPRHIDLFTEAISKNSHADTWNATGPIKKPEELDRHSFVKCAVSPSDQILFCFRRTPCFSSFETQTSFIRKILGIIAFKKEIIIQVSKLSRSPIEKSESIEQLRLIENGYRLCSVPVKESMPSVNEPGEADIIEKNMKENREQIELLKSVLAF